MTLNDPSRRKTMMKFAAAALSILILALAPAPPARAAGKPPIDLTAELGAVFPDGSLSRYASDGFAMTVRGLWHLPGTEVVGLWGDFGLNVFSSEERRVTIPVDGGIAIPVEQQTSSNGISFHIGGALSPGSRRSFFRPRLGAGIGAYNLSTDISWKGTHNAEPFARTTVDSDWGWGWRGLAGADFFFGRSWGVAVDYVLDQVYDLDKTEGGETDDSPSSFDSILVGVTFALDRTN
jgi:hypothetical protein